MAIKIEEIIEPIDRNLIKEELNKISPARLTRKGENEIYILNHHNAPHTMLEIGRLRELSFRSAGGGTKKSFDIDDYDTKENGYQQLIVWSPEDEEIIGGYRFIDCRNALLENKDTIPISTAHYFELSEQFKEKYLPFTIELGRSWVQPKYQPSVNPRKGLYALDNIWDGLAVLTVVYPNLKYFFGKVTMYTNYNIEARDYLLCFLEHYFPDNENLASPISPIDKKLAPESFKDFIGDLDFKNGFKKLNTFIREKGENIPPLINIYMNLSPTMKTFGTAQNKDFGGVEETAILVTIADIYEDKKERHISPLLK